MGASPNGSQRKLAALARRQHGLFTLDQALDCGFTRPYVRRRLADAAWGAVETRVYRLRAASPLTWEQRLMARVLATNGVACGRSAAALYDLLSPPPVPEVAVLRGARSSRHYGPGVIATDSLAACDITTATRIPTTTPARTLIMLGSSMPEPSFRDVLDTAIVRGLVTPRRLAERATALWAPRRRGCAVVLRLLANAHPELWRARNTWEARVIRLLKQAGAPDPIPNYKVMVGGQTRVIDLAWPARMVAVEFDGFVPHSTRRVFDDDRERQNFLVDAGWRIFRLTSTAIRRQPQRAIAPVLRAICPAALS